MLRRRFAWLVACALACGTLSCAALLGFERLSEEGSPDASDGTAPDAATVADGGDGGSGGPCSELGVPGPPADASGGATAPILGALRLLDFGVDVDGGRPEVPGFNLDLTCSFDVATSSCETKLLPTTFETHARDKTATGVDNAGFSLIEYISRFSEVLSAKGINDGLREGRYGAVVRVEGWNGQLDDDSVSVEIFPAVGFKPRPGGGGAQPLFDADDEWLLDRRFQVGGVLEASVIKSDRAWVTGGQLVARLKELVLPILIADDPKPFDIRLRDVVVTAKLSGGDAGGGSLHDGVIAGRWKTSEFLEQVRTIYVRDALGLRDTTLCEQGAQLIYTGVKAQICEARDLRSDSADDKGLPCDAISAAARIETYVVKAVGEFVDAPDGGPRCGDAAVIPLGDDCRE